TTFSQIDLSPNAGQYRVYHYKMAVDPANKDVVYLASRSNGCFATFGGTTGGSWSSVSGVATNDSNQNGCVAFDGSSGTAGGKTNIIYLSVSGTGLYKSSDAGGSFSLVGSTPTQILNLRVHTDGAVYVVNSDQTLHRLVGSTWTDITPAALSANVQSIMLH